MHWRAPRTERFARDGGFGGEHIALGSGVGSFQRVYRHFEDHSAVTRTFANHAHNDYLELALETGIPGILLLVLFFYWWGSRAVPIWRTAAC